jgi:hypothetical protein
MFAAKAKAYLVMKFLGPTLNRTFKNLLPANDQVLLDQNKPKELTMLKSKEMNLHAMSIMTVMLSESDLMLMMVESSKSQIGQMDWRTYFGRNFSGSSSHLTRLQQPNRQ